jgi:hypothetical protein
MVRMFLNKIKTYSFMRKSYRLDWEKGSLKNIFLLNKKYSFKQKYYSLNKKSRNICILV